MQPAVGPPVAWMVTRDPVAYEVACAYMARRVTAIATGAEPEAVWLLEHPPLYTAGTSAKPEDLIAPTRFPVYRTGRGGQFTYHGPGQRVAYVMLNVKRRFGDVRAYVASLEDWAIDALAVLGISGERQPGRVGVWVRRREFCSASGSHDKIAAIGVRLSRWVSSHGVSLNVAPNLDHYAGIVPCGIRDGGVTSLADLGVTAGIADVDTTLRNAFEQRFAATLDVMDLPAALLGEPALPSPQNETRQLPGGPDSWRAR